MRVIATMCRRRLIRRHAEGNHFCCGVVTRNEVMKPKASAKSLLFTFSHFTTECIHNMQSTVSSFLFFILVFHFVGFFFYYAIHCERVLAPKELKRNEMKMRCTKREKKTHKSERNGGRRASENFRYWPWPTKIREMKNFSYMHSMSSLCLDVKLHFIVHLKKRGHRIYEKFVGGACVCLWLAHQC